MKRTRILGWRALGRDRKSDQIQILFTIMVIIGTFTIFTTKSCESQFVTRWNPDEIFQALRC